MITTLKFMALLLSFSATKTMNPVKMSMILLILSSIIFLIMQEKTQNMWYPSIFFLLFMGGILIMFMIMASLMPNEKSLKMKTLIFSSLVTITLLLTQPENLPSTLNLTLKWMITSNATLEFLLVLMLTYFMMFMLMMEKEKTPLRSTICH